ncbi:uncharacterized protein VNE69_12086 [Vairimorpha necatrix]|uniref:Uncharacterized protein n=1 Tax=Vairimorpha necatrix TaxID=6039 RepID=A0AAX4JGN4_9MICR
MRYFETSNESSDSSSYSEIILERDSELNKNFEVNRKKMEIRRLEQNLSLLVTTKKNKYSQQYKGIPKIKNTSRILEKLFKIAIPINPRYEINIGPPSETSNQQSTVIREDLPEKELLRRTFYIAGEMRRKIYSNQNLEDLSGMLSEHEDCIDCLRARIKRDMIIETEDEDYEDGIILYKLWILTTFYKFFGKDTFDKLINKLNIPKNKLCFIKLIRKYYQEL